MIFLSNQLLNNFIYLLQIGMSQTRKKSFQNKNKKMADLSDKLFVQSRIYGHNSDEIILISNNSKLVDRTFELFLNELR